MSILFTYANGKLLSVLKVLDNDMKLHDSFMRSTDHFLDQTFYDAIVHIIQRYLELAGETDVSRNETKNLAIINDLLSGLSQLRITSFQDIKSDNESPNNKIASAIYAGAILALFTSRKKFGRLETSTTNWEDSIGESESRWEKGSLAEDIRVCDIIINNLKDLLRACDDYVDVKKLVTIALYAIDSINANSKALKANHEIEKSKVVTTVVEKDLEPDTVQNFVYAHRYTFRKNPGMWFLTDFPRLCELEAPSVKYSWIVFSILILLVVMPLYLTYVFICLLFTRGHFDGVEWNLGPVRDTNSDLEVADAANNLTQTVIDLCFNV